MLQCCSMKLISRVECRISPLPGQQLSHLGRLPSELYPILQNHCVQQLRYGRSESMFREVPKQGQLSVEDVTTMVLCKPKLLPLKSLTLEKLEKMQQAAQDTIRQQEMAEKEQQQITH
ncbi:BBSome-interacting protein 1-like [Choloepus didactylus]|uniref:BBSome-interacting protein 1-like n=1 Tax=Choloepus didactylus TaxID=27675 RepID=UPI0018A080C3|nr:BBSome-interacting protein 1-like [Choloepus didactylus]